MTTDFDKMAADAEAALGAGAAGGTEPGTEKVVAEPIPSLTNAQAIEGAVIMAREAFCGMTKLKSPRAALPNEGARQLGELWGPVCDKHGINLAEWIGDYVLEFSAIMATVAILTQVRAAVQAEIAAMKAAEKKPEPAAADGTQA